MLCRNRHVSVGRKWFESGFIGILSFERLLGFLGIEIRIRTVVLHLLVLSTTVKEDVFFGVDPHGG